MKKMLAFIASCTLFFSINPNRVGAEENDLCEENGIESQIVELNARKAWFSVDRPMPSDWNPPRTISTVQHKGGVRYAGTLSYAGSANRNGRVVAVYTGYLYEDTGNIPILLKQLEIDNSINQ